MKIKVSRYGPQFNKLSSDAMRLIKHRTLKSHTLDELLRFAKLLALRKKRYAKSY